MLFTLNRPILHDIYSRFRSLARVGYYSSQGKVNRGYCPICERRVFFLKKGEWLRDNYRCYSCNSIPRQRAIISALNVFYPDWRDLVIHESSPSGPASAYLARHCTHYSLSYFFQDIPYGDYKEGKRCENLEQLTFPDESLDLLITQDVFEHVMHPDLAFKEISRVLKVGGAHVFTMPWYPEQKKTVQRARLNDNSIEFLEEPVYHGNPISQEGSLVTFDWGIDFTDFIYKNAGMFTTVYLEKDKNKGLEAEFLEVFVSRKPATVEQPSP